MPQPTSSRIPSPQAAAVWLIVVLALAWITHEGLLGDVEHTLSADQIRRGTIARTILPAPPFPWPRELEVRLFEDGRPLGPAVDHWTSIRRAGRGAHASLVWEASGLQRHTALYFTASDGSEPRRNGRIYTVRYQRRALPATFALLLASWVVLPVAAVRISRALARPPPGRATALGVAGWSALVAGGLYTLFALQAWLPPSNAPWLLTVAAVGIAPFLAGLPFARSSLPGWCLWCAGLLAWVLFTAFGGSSYASPGLALGFLTVSSGGTMLYLGARGALERSGREGWPPTLVLFTLAALASLARDAGFDLAGGLASLELAQPWMQPIANPWTSKFLAHWLLVLFWCSLLAVAASGRSHRSHAAWIAGLGLAVLWMNGSKSALAALLLSLVVAGVAMLRPRVTRRLAVVALVAGVLAAPLLAAVPWRVHSSLSSHLGGGPLSVLEMDIRGGVWEYSRQLIALDRVDGWGFGSSARLPGRDLTLADALEIAPGRSNPELGWHFALPGGHPHNAALLTWLDLGLIGALLVAGLIVAVGRSIAGVESRRGTHAALLGLLTVTATFLAFNYPVWEPEVTSILWMSAALAASHLSRPVVDRREHLRSAAAVVAILAIGCAFLVEGRASRWLAKRDLRASDPVLELDAGTLVLRDRVLELDSDGRIDAGASLFTPGETTFIHGWAYGPPGAGAPDVVLVFVGGELVGTVWPEWPSPQVFARAENPDVRALVSGFLFPVEPDRLDLDAPVRVVMLRRQSTLVAELPALAPADDTPLVQVEE